MPPMEIDCLLQDAVLWEALPYADALGNFQLADPVEVKVRWTWGTSTGQDPLGNDVALDARAAVDREIAVGSVMFLGTLSEWNGTGSVGEASPLHQVKTSREAVDIKNRAGCTRRTIGLARFRDKLPVPVNL